MRQAARWSAGAQDDVNLFEDDSEFNDEMDFSDPTGGSSHVSHAQAAWTKTLGGTVAKVYRVAADERETMKKYTTNFFTCITQGFNPLAQPLLLQLRFAECKSKGGALMWRGLGKPGAKINVSVLKSSGINPTPRNTFCILPVHLIDWATTVISAASEGMTEITNMLTNPQQKMCKEERAFLSKRSRNLQIWRQCPTVDPNCAVFC